MRRSRYALIAALTGNVGLIASLFVIAGVSNTARLVLATVFALPLLAAAYGLARRRIYTAAWASMAALFYLAYATVEYIAGHRSLGVDLCLLSSLVFFMATVLFAQWDARERQAIADTSKD